MALTDAKVRAAKPLDKSYKLTDGDGMHLMVHTNGSKYWRLQYRFGGKQKMLALGIYPDISLAEAREKRDTARKLIANGFDPRDYFNFTATGYCSNYAHYRFNGCVNQCVATVVKCWDSTDSSLN